MRSIPLARLSAMVCLLSACGSEAPNAAVVPTTGNGGNGGTAAGAGGSGTAAGASGSSGSAAGAGGSNGGALPSTFVTMGRTEATCPLLPSACAGWPKKEAGTVYRYVSEETGAGTTRARSFYVFVPAAAKAASPIVLALHGGNGTGARLLATTPWVELAQANAAGIAWRQNTAACTALPTSEANGLVYRTPSDQACVPPEITYVNSLPFVVVFPEGVADPGKQVAHWEDGRIPSPGFDTPGPNRDDVGFIDHVLATTLADTALPVDPARIYVTGISNGGIMTQRIAASVDNPAYPRLAKVAAFASFVANLAEPITLGAASRPFGLALFFGTGITMPDCNTPGCTSPTVLGDDRMPFGVAGSGHYVNSPDRGRVHSGPDTIEAWRSAMGVAPLGAPETIGFSTRTSYVAAPAALQVWITDGGGHSYLSSRSDFAPIARAWAFVSTFRREPAGALVREQATWMSGTF